MTLCTRFQSAALLFLLFLISSGSGRAQTTPRPANPPATEEVVIEAAQQEKVGNVYHLRGSVVITAHNYVMRADEITYNSDTGDLDATGHLVFDGGPHDEHIEASHATYNRITDSGKFYDVVGSTGARFRGSHVLLTSSNPFAFKGKVVEKVGRDLFIIHNGMVTDCRIERPKWTFQTQKAVVLLGDNAKLYHATFRLIYFPIFYFPYTRLPVERIGRQSGILIPGIGQSSLKGTILGESFYWAINRSLDATIGAEYYSAIGWAQHGEFRSRPSATSFFNATYFGVLDRNSGPTGVNQGGEEVKADGTAQLRWGFRGVANIDYLSSYLFRQTFSESYTQATNSETNTIGFASKSTNGYFFNVMAARYQNFQSTTPGDLIAIVHAPSLDLGSVEHPIGTSPVQWSYDTALARRFTKRAWVPDRSPGGKIRRHSSCRASAAFSSMGHTARNQPGRYVLHAGTRSRNGRHRYSQQLWGKSEGVGNGSRDSTASSGSHLRKAGLQSPPETCDRANRYLPLRDWSQ